MNKRNIPKQNIIQKRKVVTCYFWTFLGIREQIKILRHYKNIGLLLNFTITAYGFKTDLFKSRYSPNSKDYKKLSKNPNFQWIDSKKSKLSSNPLFSSNLQWNIKTCLNKKTNSLQNNLKYGDKLIINIDLSVCLYRDLYYWVIYGGKLLTANVSR